MHVYISCIYIYIYTYVCVMYVYKCRTTRYKYPTKYLVVLQRNGKHFGPTQSSAVQRWQILVDAKPVCKWNAWGARSVPRYDYITFYILYIPNIHIPK